MRVRELAGPAFRVELPDRPGGLHALAGRLAAAGIGVRGLYCASRGGASKVVLAVDRPDEAAGIVRECEESLAP